eukprot:CAMPEP_0203687944 /NCGR_PEP_ID=MMETSP0091-20130426/827_1 /ASSEMBLY_ACC=CAM_ASM_001089 /TAXON_ID=426623 /ORGANISM="Chaetoceros affinis, Strain CCMP159" /LENGTH=279 /DNA_ID=CAMNT_0050557383 /DNA_START=74 /DNA_END=913 /DNA_ORIENTATION=-
MKLVSTFSVIFMLLALNSLECVQARNGKGGKGVQYSYSYEFPTSLPSSEPSSIPSPAPPAPYCPPSELDGQTFYAPALGHCFKMTPFNGGRVSINVGDAKCKESFEGRVIGVYNRRSGNKFFYDKKGIGGNGVLSFKEDPTVSAATIEVIKFNFSNKNYEFEVTVPSCEGGKRDCLRRDVVGQTFIGSVGKNCLEVELFTGGKLNVDLGDDTCDDQKFTLEASTFDYIRKNVATFTGGLYSGTVTVVENGVPGTEFVMDLNKQAKTFDLEIRLRTCDEP